MSMICVSLACFFFFFLELRPPRISTRRYTLFPYTTLFRSSASSSLASDVPSVAVAETVYRNGSCVGRDRKSTRLNSSHVTTSRMPSSALNKKTEIREVFCGEDHIIAIYINFFFQ